MGVLTTAPGPLLVKEEPSAEAAPRVTSCHCGWKNLEAIRVTQLPSIKRERENLFDVKLLVKTPDIPTGYTGGVGHMMFQANYSERSQAEEMMQILKGTGCSS